MTSSHNLLLLVLLVPFLSPSSAADPIWNLCSGDSSSNQISDNIKHLLPELVSKTASTRYTSTSIGQGKDTVYGLAQCREDVDAKDCSNCLQEASNQIQKVCPTQVDARIVYDYCVLRYSTENFFGKLDTGSGIFYINVENVTTDTRDFNKKLGALLDKVKSQAIMPKNKGMGKNEIKITDFVTLYALAQCTGDLTAVDCAQCIAIGIGNFPTFCNNRKGCRAVYSSCYVRYELYPFFFPLDSSTNPLIQNTVAIVHP